MSIAIAAFKPNGFYIQPIGKNSNGTDKKPIDITNSLLFFDYYEDILSPCIFATAMIMNSASIFNILPIRGGEKVGIDVDTAFGNFKFDGESVPAKLISKNTTQETTPNFVKHVVAMVEKYQSLTIAQLGQPRLMDEARIREMKDYVGHQNGWATRVFELSVQSSSKVTLDYSKKPLTLYLA